MKMTLNIMLSLLLFFSFSLCVSSQSTEEELDQVELMKQFIGTWEAKGNGDTVYIMKNTPFGDGFVFTNEIRTKGKTIQTVSGVWGVSSDKKLILSAGMGQDGITGYGNGRFVSKKRHIQERYYDYFQHPVGFFEFEFQSTTSFTTRYKWRGNKMTWDIDWTPKNTFEKVE